MAPRATWKGYVKVGELAFPVALYAAATTAKRISFHVLNRKTGNRVHREYIDEETEKPVDKEQQVKGYQVGNHYVVLEPEEIAETMPVSDKTISVEAFVPYDEVDEVYFDRPYYLSVPKGEPSEAFAVVREGMRKRKVAALGRAVLFRRVRTVLLRPEDSGFSAHTLNFDYQVRDAGEIFDDLPDLEIKGEMLKLAEHIIDTKRGSFDPAKFDDRYDQALAELIKAKQEGREIELPKPRKEGKVVDLMEALRQSAAASGKAQGKAATKKAAGKRAAASRSSAKRRKAEPAPRRKAS
jgi:DNA end-binding protein Ku